jgi:hypothetical protein
MRLPTPTPPILALRFIAIRLPAPPLLGSDSVDETTTTSSPAPTGLRMAPDTLEQTDLRNCVSQAAEMANAENLAGYFLVLCCLFSDHVSIKRPHLPDFSNAGADNFAKVSRRLSRKLR